MNPKKELLWGLWVRDALKFKRCVGACFCLSEDGGSELSFLYSF